MAWARARREGQGAFASRVYQRRQEANRPSNKRVWFLTPYGFWSHYQTAMKAELLFRQRIDYDDGAIVEMVLWRVPSPVRPSVHGLKYSLFYGRPGIREVGYDNERGKGDHWHFGGAETAYAFTSVEKLVADFWSDVRTLRGEI
jgi:hypothetical protein